ncbi:unnamed protein product, partial [Allacma fusca]
QALMVSNYLGTIHLRSGSGLGKLGSRK